MKANGIDVPDPEVSRRERAEASARAAGSSSRGEDAIRRQHALTSSIPVADQAQLRDFWFTYEDIPPSQDRYVEIREGNLYCNI